MKRSWILAIVITLLSSGIFAQSERQSKVSPEKRQKWINEAIAKLESFRIDSSVFL